MLSFACTCLPQVSEPTLSYSDFQRLLWALSRIDYVPSRAWLAQFVEVRLAFDHVCAPRTRVRVCVCAACHLCCLHSMCLLLTPGSSMALHTPGHVGALPARATH